MTEINAEDLIKLLEEAKAQKERKAEMSRRWNTIGSALLLVALGIVGSSIITWKVCSIRETKRLEAHDAAIRNAINQDFEMNAYGQSVVEKMDLWTVFSSLGSDSVNAHKMADWNGQQMGNCYRELQGMKTRSYTPSTAVMPQDPAVQVLNAIRPGLGTAAAALSAAVQKSQAEKQAIAAQQVRNTASQPVASATRQPVLFCPSGDCAACPDGYGLSIDSETQKHVCALTGN